MSVQSQTEAGSPVRAHRPDVLNLITILSFLFSGLNVLWLILVSLLILTASALTWLAGPALGLFGTLVGGVAVVILLAQFALSVMLFAAAWGTLHGTMGGYDWHRTWAWIIVVVDLLSLLVTGGVDFAAWVRLGYAVFLIVTIGRPEVRTYFGLPNTTAA